MIGHSLGRMGICMGQHTCAAKLTHINGNVGLQHGITGDKIARTPSLASGPAPHFPAQLCQFGQHCQYFTVYVWNNTHVKRNYLI